VRIADTASTACAAVGGRVRIVGQGSDAAQAVEAVSAILTSASEA
jgi:phosphotransferase system HPr-like phosphotransfer protein